MSGTLLSRTQAWNKARVASVCLSLAAAVFAFASGIRAGFDGREEGVLFGILLSGTILGGVMLVGAGEYPRSGATVMLSALVAWIAWVVVGDPEALDRTWPWWAALAAAAAIGARGQA